MECTSCVESETNKNNFLLGDHISLARLSSNADSAVLHRKIALFLGGIGIYVGIDGVSSIRAVIRWCIGTIGEVTIGIFPKRY
jgi:hypothetical protein